MGTEPLSRVGIFGGTFDPIHLGHLILASEIRFSLGLDRVLFVPAGIPPHKPAQPISSARHRLEMLHLALSENSAFDIHTIDIDRGGISFTVETLELLARELAPSTLVFLMGEDSLRDLPTWRAPGQIATNAELAVATRPGVEVDFRDVIAAVPETRGRIHLIPTPSIEISASDIRNRVATRAPIHYMVPDSVGRYIFDHGLYT
ncbi:MAG: nicotinate-nucleotide adenylyltransferase [Chloroflexota bacterium]|nr:nicotinate-nucleotide adenylyltransferase [Chloroflexota bacterium]